MAPPPALTDDLVGEILLRIPPEEPAHLVRASLVCKSWLRRLSEPAFLRCYREFHRTPPLLGFLHNLSLDDDDDVLAPGLVPTTAASPLSPPDLGCSSSLALDCRHGRVLFHALYPMGGLVVWDPITGDQKQFPLPDHPHTYCTAAVLCAKAGCDHLGCSGGPFLVVSLGTDDGKARTWVSVYSSETGVWSASASVVLGSYVEMRPSNLTRNALFFMLDKSILKYDLGQRTLFMITQPKLYQQRSIVMTAEDGALGFAGINGRILYLWGWKDRDEDIALAGWTLRRVIVLDGLIPIRNVSVLPDVIGFVEGTRTIFISTDAGVFTLDLKSRKVKKVGEKGGYVAVLPFTSFYAPVHARG